MFSLLMIGCSCLAQAETAEQSEAARQVARLVRLLNDDQWSRRQNAEDALIEMGPEILRMLPHSSSRLSTEAKVRLKRVRNHLQEVYARRAVDASRVTLRGAMTLGQALQTLQESTGNAMEGYSEFADQPITIYVREVPFWEALDQVLDQAQLTIDPYAGRDGVLRIVRRDDNQANRYGRACYEGIFRIQPTYIAAMRDLLDPSVKRLRVRVSVAWEPRTEPISVSLSLSGITARDDHGNPVRVDAESGRLSASVEANVQIVEMELPLELPLRESRFLDTLEGTFDVMIPGQIETFEFSDLDKKEDQQERRAGVAVSLTEVRKNDDVDVFSVHLQFDQASNALESHRGWIFKNEAYVIDSAGRRTEHGGRRLIGRDENSIHMGFLFALDQPLADYKFVYETPSLIIQEPVRFKLEKIDLP